MRITQKLCKASTKIDHSNALCGHSKISNEILPTHMSFSFKENRISSKMDVIKICTSLTIKCIEERNRLEKGPIISVAENLQSQ